MMVWIITVILSVLVGCIVWAEVICGRRSKDFLETITPEIDALTKSVVNKYLARHGRYPSGIYPITQPPPSLSWRRFFRR